MNRLLIVAFVFLLSGCEMLRNVEVDVCVDYKGQHVCVGRKDGRWTFSVDLSPEEQADLIASLGGK